MSQLSPELSINPQLPKKTLSQASIYVPQDDDFSPDLTNHTTFMFVGFACCAFSLMFALNMPTFAGGVGFGAFIAVATVAFAQAHFAYEVADAAVDTSRAAHAQAQLMDSQKGQAA